MTIKVNSGSSKLGTGCMILFGLPFFGMGALAFVQGIRKFGSGDKEAVVLIAVGGLFACVGLGIMALGIFAGKLGKKQDELKQRFPDEPWMWRKTWKNGIVTSNTTGGLIGIGIFALFWNAISWISVFAVPWQKELAKNKAALFILLFPAIGIILIITFIYTFLRAKKYGNSVFHMETFPGVIGGQMRGMVKVPAEIFPEHGIKVRLVSVQQYQSGTGKNRSTSERILWEDDRTIKETTRRNRQTEIPVEFTIPSSCTATTLGSPGHDVIWRISVSAETAGIDYASHFEVPVFVTEESSDAVAIDEISVDTEVTANDDSDDKESFRQVCRDLGIVCQHPGRGRMTLDFKAFQNKGAACSISFFFLIWTGIVVALFMYAPIFFAVVFGLFDILIFMMMVSMVLSSSTIEVNSREIRITKKILGIGGSKRIPLSAFQSIRPASNTQVGNKRIYHLMFKDKTGKEISGGGQIPSKQKAMKVVYEIMKVVRENAD